MSTQKNLQTNLCLYYRYICKNFQNSDNRKYFKNIIKEFNTKNTPNKTNKIIWSNLLFNLNKMNYHIDKENSLLADFNINIIRDRTNQIEQVANRVGLSI